MISGDVLRQAEDFQAKFQAAKPFKHVCIDGFLEGYAAEQALTDFPSFDKSKAVNEYGEIGKKAVNTRLAAISPFYAKIYEYLFSVEFLASMSQLTGIQDLIGDPTMYGGGTHENLHGQELDAHVDFNYVAGGNAHRRLNLLIYLNKNWDSAWGGDIEIHSNPRDPDTNEIRSYRVDFNRAILFETNEYSWHGFPKVNLPISEQDTNSRKCISIYLYTRTRPQEEIAGTHGTFYVQRPLDKRFQAGHILSLDDVQELNAGYRNRDRYIEYYQKQEEKISRETANLHGYIHQLVSEAKLPTLGYARQLRRLAGEFWQDGWAGDEFTVEMRAMRSLTSIELQGYLPDSAPTGERLFHVDVDGAVAEFSVLHKEMFSWKLPVSIADGAVFRFTIKCTTNFGSATCSTGGDDRRLIYMIVALIFNEEDVTRKTLSNPDVVSEGAR